MSHKSTTQVMLKAIKEVVEVLDNLRLVAATAIDHEHLPQDEEEYDYRASLLHIDDQRNLRKRMKHADTLNRLGDVLWNIKLDIEEHMEDDNGA